MNSRPTKKINRSSGFALTRQRKRAQMPSTVSNDAWIKLDATNDSTSTVGRYVGPSVGGNDLEYIKIISGNVVGSKPSFAQ